MELNVVPGSWLNLTDLLEFQGVVFWDQTDYPDIPFTDSDQYIQLTRLQAQAVDQLAFQVYGDPKLFWVILLANNKFYLDQFIEGETIRVPSKTTVDQIFEAAKSVAR